MKKLLPFVLMIIYASGASGQGTGLYQDFESACTTPAGFPADWTYYNPIAATMPDGQWTCAPGNGRNGSNGISCTSVWGSPGAYHFDTSYLVSPPLDLSGYAGSIYLRFDTKTSNINLAGRLSFILSSGDTTFDTTNRALFADRTTELSPTFSNDDSTEWVTHVADLTPYKNAIPLYIAFRYTANNASGSTWYIDNVYTTPFVEYVPQLSKDALSVNVIGASTTSRITLSCETGSAGTYHLGIYDMLGREVYQEEMQLSGSKATYPINGLSLPPGLYLLKMNNGLAYCTAKTVVY
jgi:hypothetical protein